MIDIDEATRRERELRHGTYQWIESELRADAAAVAAVEAKVAKRELERGRVLAALERLQNGGTADEFIGDLKAASPANDSELAIGSGGAHVLLGQLSATTSDRLQLTWVLRSALVVPTDDEDAQRKFELIVDHCDSVRTGKEPQDSRIPTLLSAIWFLQAPQQWSPQWVSGVQAFSALGWATPVPMVDRYLAFNRIIRDLGDPVRVTAVLEWFFLHPIAQLDPVTIDRVAFSHDIFESRVGSTYPRGMKEVGIAVVDAMTAEMRRVGDLFRPIAEQGLDRSLSRRIPTRYLNSSEKILRLDTWVDWEFDTPEFATNPALRLWIGRERYGIVLLPGRRYLNWTAAMRAIVENWELPAGIELLQMGVLKHPQHQAPGGKEFMLGRTWLTEQFDSTTLVQQLADTAKTLRPLLDRLLVEGGSLKVSETASPAKVASPELLERFERFCHERPYPDDRDKAQPAKREAMAQALSKAALPALDIAEFRRIMNTREYGFAGHRGVLNTYIGGPDEDALQQEIVSVLDDLLWGESSLAERIDRAIDPETGLKGLGAAGAMKLLAIAHPDRILPIFPFTGPAGKLSLLPALGLQDAIKGTVGEQQIASNDAIRGLLSAVPELADDPWGQMQFAYWLRDSGDAPLDDLETRLAAASEACTLPDDSTFLHELTRLLETKGQIVLYGPPGTGKTFVADHLAKALAPDENRRMLVQFHPSYAYEDFIEGYRPVSREGGIAYELVEGPLVEMAERARLDPRPHVLIIDELNRANVPKVFGELLYLLEYRDQPMKLAYRSKGDTFELPKNLWIIATMNLADRSVGHIDAALRRRFHFVPFGPADEHNGGLLRRWLEKRGEPTWLADLIDSVNTELHNDMGHADLLIGPSYFMKAETPKLEGLELIWRYDIEPVLSEVFFGDAQLVRKYLWPTILKRHAEILPINVGGEEGSIDADGAETSEA